MTVSLIEKLRLDSTRMHQLETELIEMTELTIELAEVVGISPPGEKRRPSEVLLDVLGLLSGEQAAWEQKKEL